MFVSLKALRNWHGISQAQLARHSGLTQGRISQIEKRHELNNYITEESHAKWYEGLARALTRKRTPDSLDHAIEAVREMWKEDAYHDKIMACLLFFFKRLGWETEENGTNETSVIYRKHNIFTEGKVSGRPDITFDKYKLEACRTKDLQSNRKKFQREAYGQGRSPTLLTDGRIITLYDAKSCEMWNIDLLNLNPQDRKHLLEL